MGLLHTGRGKQMGRGRGRERDTVKRIEVVVAGCSKEEVEVQVLVVG